MTDVALPKGVTLVDDPMPAVQISTAAVEATVTLQGAQIIAWTPTGADPVLYLSKDSHWQPGTPIRGGIPVCFPWFGGGRNHIATSASHHEPVVTLEPSHGWARIVDWTLVDASVARDGTASLVFELSGAAFVGATHHRHVPADVMVRYTMHLGTDLRLVLEVISGGSLVDVETLLHTYLSVPDVDRVTIAGLDQAPYWDKVERRARTQEGELVITGQTDRVYDTSAVIRVTTGKRTIQITTTGSKSTVVWNPGADKARTLDDFGDQDYRQMVCVESGNVLHNAITVAPGQSQVMTVTYRII